MLTKRLYTYFFIIAVLLSFSCRTHRDNTDKTQRQTYSQYLEEKKSGDHIKGHHQKSPKTQKYKNRWEQKHQTKNKEDDPYDKTEDKPKESKGFYSKYGEKWGVEFKGNENPELIKEVDDWIGTPYKYGGTSKAGTDCSGFVITVYKKVYGVDLNRSARDLVQNTRLINENELRFSDLVFFKIEKNTVSHVGIYLGSNKFVHASSKRGVVVSDLTATYYQKYFYKGGRVNGIN